jgi:hypothetical protein
MLAASLAGCPGVQISSNGGSAPPASTQTTTPTSAAVPTNAPSTGPALLSWEAPTENEDGTPIEELVGYRIHFGASATELNEILEVSGAASTTYAIDGLSAGTYYFAVAAYNAFGIEGPLSNIASKSF